MPQAYEYGREQADGTVRSILGTDARVYIDGRYGRSRATAEVVAHAYYLNDKLNKGITHYAKSPGGMNMPSASAWRRLPPKTEKYDV